MRSAVGAARIVAGILLAVGALLASGIIAVRRTTDPRWATTIAMAVVPYAVITCLVCNLLLRGIPTADYLGQEWMNETLHVVAPIYLVIDWFLLRLGDHGRARLAPRALAIALAAIAVTRHRPHTLAPSHV